MVSMIDSGRGSRGRRTIDVRARAVLTLSGGTIPFNPTRKGDLASQILEGVATKSGQISFAASQQTFLPAKDRKL